MVLATAEITNTHAQAMGPLGQLLHQCPEAVLNELGSALQARLNQVSEDVTGNSQEIQTLFNQLANLPLLTPQQLQQVIAEIDSRVSNLNIDSMLQVFMPDGTEVDATDAVQKLLKVATETVIAVGEAQLDGNGHVSQAVVELANGQTRQVTFTRTENETGTEATYLGQLSNGQGGLAQAYQFVLKVHRLNIAGLNLSSTWDCDLLSMRTYTTGYAYQIAIVSENGPRLLAGDWVADGDAPPATFLSGSAIQAAGDYRFYLRYTQTVADQVVRLVVDDAVLSSYAAAEVGPNEWEIDVHLTDGVSVTFQVGNAATTQISQIEVAPISPASASSDNSGEDVPDTLS